MTNGTSRSAGWALLCIVLAFTALALSPKISLAASTETTLTGAPNSSAAGETVTFTATVAGFGGGAPTGTVTFNNGATELDEIAVSNIGVGHAIAAGDTHTCALTSTGGVKCAGWTLQGRLGDGNTPDPAEAQATPVDVSNLTDATAVTVGYQHSCAVTDTGGVKCWGANFNGQLGDGTQDNISIPVDVIGLTNAVSVRGGGTFTCVLTSAGGVKCWGQNASGQLGDGTQIDSFTPVDVSGLTSGVIAISISPGSGHACALTKTGGVKCWGDGSNGQLGDNSANVRIAPVDVSGLTSGVSAIAAGSVHTCALTTAGGIKCWGRNSDGQLGDGTTDLSTTPVDVPGLANIVAITAGQAHTCALTSAGGMKCWGGNLYGQLGNGNSGAGAQMTPVDVNDLASGVSMISAGTNTTCAVTTAGVPKCWGDGLLGQLGNGNSGFAASSSVPGDFLGTTAPVFGKATFSTAALAIGDHSITATYNGDGSYDPSTSDPLTQTVAKAASSTSLGSSDTTTTFGQSVTFTATVVGAGATGTVTFQIGGVNQNPLGTVSSGTATFTTSALAVDDHSVVAIYNGDSNYFGSTSSTLTQTVGKAATTVSVSGAPNPSTPGQAVLFTANISVTSPGAGSPAGTVTFKEGSTTLGTGSVSSGHATLSKSGLTIGSHTITAIYAGNGNFTGNSGTGSVAVSAKLGVQAGANTRTTGSQQLPAIAKLKSGYFVAWASNAQDASGYGIYGQRYTAAAAKAGSELHISTRTAGNQTMPKVAGLKAGGFVTVWQSDAQDGSSSGIYAQNYNAGGGKIGAEFRVNTTATGAQSQPAIAPLTGGGFVAAWTSNGQDSSGLGIYAQRYDAAGAKVGTEFLVNTTTAGAQSAPTIAALTNGGFMIAWQGPDASGLGIYGQRFTSAGVKSGVEFRVSTITAGDQSLPSATGLSDGGFMVAWQSPLQDGSGLGVYEQRYNSAGAKVSGEVRVNTMTANDQSQPQVSGFSNGGFIVLWTSKLQDGSGLGVYAQAYKATGVRANVEFLVNTTTANDQWQPGVAAGATGEFMAAWTSKAQDGSLEGIYTQRFKVPVAP